MTVGKFSRALVAAAIGVALAVAPGSGSASASAPKRLHPTGALSGGPRKLPGVRPSIAADLPTSVDLSPWAMPVGDQGPIGSCVPWAIDYNMMGWYANRAGESFAGAPMYVYSQIHVDSSPEGGGSYPSDAYNVATTQGVDTQTDYTQGNYDFTDLPTAAERTNAASYKISGYNVVYNTYPNGPGAAGDDAIRAELAAGHPVAITVPIYAAWDALNASDWTLDASDIDGSGYRGTHEVVIFGYDAQGVRIENQWGTGWGQAGWANLDWNFIEQYSTEATAASGLVTTPAVPSSPSAVSAAAHSSTVATLSWQPPTSDGGAAITGYTVSRDGGTGWSTTVAPTARSQSFVLSPGMTYHLSVSAINADGNGPVVSVPVTMPASSLTAPQSFKIAGHKATKSATISWKPPATNGGSPITGYKVTRSGSPAWSKVVSASARSQSFSALKIGVNYVLSVQAITAAATGPAASGTIKL